MFHLGVSFKLSLILCTLASITPHLLQIEISLLRIESCITLWYNDRSLKIGLIDIH